MLLGINAAEGLEGLLSVRDGGRLPSGSLSQVKPMLQSSGLWKSITGPGYLSLSSSGSPRSDCQWMVISPTSRVGVSPPPPLYSRLSTALWGVA